jgi:subtilase family protein/peptidase inhibitor I9
VKRTRVLLGIGLAAAFVASAQPFEADAGPSTAARSAAQAAPAALAASTPQSESDPVPPGRDIGDVEPATTDDVLSTEGRNESMVARFAAGPGTSTYLIQFREQAVPSYRGGVPGLAPTAVPSGEKLDTTSRAVTAYADHLESAQAEFIERADRTAGRSVDVRYQYTYAVNGIAVDLTAVEARKVSRDPSVLTIVPDQMREIQSDAGPQWIGADKVWEGTNNDLPADFKGEGVVIGVIDTGISPGNRSFRATGDDGYTVLKPASVTDYLGVCDPTPIAGQVYDPAFPCNDKLIGAYNFVTAAPNTPSNALDYEGHGSHTASTAGGSVVDGVVPVAGLPGASPFDISGVAPHANIIAYLGCCTQAGLTKSIDQAIADHVDVINYSIGSSSPSADAWTDFDTLGFLHAREAGIFVATSTGRVRPPPDPRRTRRG